MWAVCLPAQTFLQKTAGGGGTRGVSASYHNWKNLTHIILYSPATWVVSITGAKATADTSLTWIERRGRRWRNPCWGCTFTRPTQTNPWTTMFSRLNIFLSDPYIRCVSWYTFINIKFLSPQLQSESWPKIDKDIWQKPERCCMSMSAALQKQDFESLKASLGYIVRPCLTEHTNRQGEKRFFYKKKKSDEIIKICKYINSPKLTKNARA